MKKQEKKAISLIVLVVTIIVMIILAGSIIITLSNSGIIGKAQEAVDKTNLRQLQEAANVLWLDAYSGGKRTQGDLEAAVLAGLTGVDTSKYNINVTASGVTVSLKGGVTPDDPENPEVPELNEYGFYYDKAYIGTLTDGEPMGFVFREDGSVESYVTDETDFGSTDMFCMQVIQPGIITYGKGKISINGAVATVSADGTKISMSAIEFALSDEEVHGIYKGSTYAGTNEFVQSGANVKVEATGGVDTNNNMTATIMTTVNGESGDPQTLSSYIEFVGNNHIGYVNGSPYMFVSLDGKKASIDKMVLTITEVPENYVEDNTPQLNMYGFYYDQMYATDWFDEEGTDMKMGFVFHRDGSAELYVAGEDFAGGELFCENIIESGVTYAENQITCTLDGTTKTLTVQNDGSLSDGTMTLGYAPMKLHGIYRDYEYIGKMTVDTQEIDIAFTVDINNYVIGTQAGVEIINMPLNDIFGREHVLTADVGTLMVSSDGMKVVAIMADGSIMLLTRSGSINGGVTPEQPTSNTIPTGGTYYVGVTGTAIKDYSGASATLTAGDEFPTPTTGDVYVYGDYEYRYNMVPGDNWMTLSAYANQADGYELDEGWGVRVLNTEKTSYAAPLSSIAGKNIDSLVYTYASCMELTAAPAIPNTVTKLIGTYGGCIRITGSITIPNGITLIGKQTFALCGVSTVSLPESLTYIGDQAFLGANNITGMSIPKNVSHIAIGAFSGCGKVTDCVVDSANPNYTAVDGVLYTKDVTTLIWCPSGKTEETFTIPSTVTDISVWAFNGCKFSTINIPNSVTHIGGEAFESCSNLTSINIPNSVKSIGAGTFYSCYNLVTAIIGSGVESIGDNTFYMCDNLTTIYYVGTQEQWANIEKEDLGSNATIEYNYVP